MSVRRVLSLVVAGAVVLTACGGGGDEGADDTETTVVATSVAPSTTIASWGSVADILDVGTEQALPPLEGFADALRSENARIGATDGLDHDAADAGSRVTLNEGACTEVGFVDYFYEAAVGLTDTPSVGILAPAVQVYVCPDEASRAEQADFLYTIHGGSEGQECSVDDVAPDSTGPRVCPNRTLDTDRLTGWDAIAVGSVDLAMVAVTADLAPDTDPAEGAASMQALLEYATGHLEERLG